MKTTKKAVKDLKPGDDLGTCVILNNQYYGNYCGQKDRHFVKVRFASNGEESTRVWGRNTTVVVNEKV